jgi:hypothetical protein
LHIHEQLSISAPRRVPGTGGRLGDYGSGSLAQEHLRDLSSDIDFPDEFFFSHLILLMLGAVLTIKTAGRPRYRFEALDTDVGATMYASSIGAIFDALNRLSQVPQPIGVEFQLANGQLTIRGVLNLIQRICRALDGNFVEPSDGLLKNSPKRLENALEPLSVCLFHNP